MALSLKVSLGGRVFVGASQIELVSVGVADATVEVDGERAIQVYDDRSVEILPDVYLGLDNIDIHGRSVRMVFEAPRTVTILRDKLVQVENA